MKEPTSLIGQFVDGRYRLLRLLGSGGMGQVYLAEQSELSRKVAVKILHTGVLYDEELSARFLREAQSLSRLLHENIPSMLSYGIWNETTPFIVMEYIEGQTLEELLDEESALPWERALKIVTQCCSALAHSHESGVIHRDIKPGNIILMDRPRTDFVKVVDFGLAKFLSEQQEIQKLTPTGTLLGTVHYMSPEQCAGGKTDKRSDIYSLACVLYHCLTGLPPHCGDTPVIILHKHVSALPERPSSRAPGKIPQKLDTVVMKALSRDPDRRYKNMQEFALDLEFILQAGSHTQSMFAAAGAGAAESCEADLASKKSYRILLPVTALSLTAIAILAYLYAKSPSGQALLIERSLNGKATQSRLDAAILQYEELQRLDPKFSISNAGSMEKLQDRLFDYAKSVSALKSAELCSIFAAGDDERSIYWAMRGLNLLSQAETLNQIEDISALEKITDSLAAACLKSKKRLSLDERALQRMLDKLNKKGARILNLLKLKISLISSKTRWDEKLISYEGLAEYLINSKDIEEGMAFFRKAEELCYAVPNPQVPLLELYLREAGSLKAANLMQMANDSFKKAIKLHETLKDQALGANVFFTQIALSFGHLQLAQEAAECSIKKAELNYETIDAPFRSSKFFSSALRDQTGRQVRKTHQMLYTHVAEQVCHLMKVYLLKGDLEAQKRLLKKAMSSNSSLWVGVRKEEEFDAFAVVCLFQCDPGFEMMNELFQYAEQRAEMYRNSGSQAKARRYQLALDAYCSSKRQMK